MTATGDLPKVVVTGANGFVGRALMQRLAESGRFSPHGLVRNPVAGTASPGCAPGPDLDPASDWQPHLLGADAVVHAAARVHVTGRETGKALALHRCVNRDGTLALARQAAEAGIRRFVFLSTIKVMGERTEPGRPLSPQDDPAPHGAYAVSKLEAEDGLHALAAETGMELVVIRPPLVHGPGVKGNLRAMMRWLATGRPLPLGAIDNRRSLVGLGNLTSLIVTCIDHPGAAGHVWLVSDDEDVSTPRLLAMTGEALGRPARLVGVPPVLLRTAARITGRQAAASRLLDSLQLDISQTREKLSWTPPLPLAAGIREMADAFRGNGAR